MTKLVLFFINIFDFFHKKKIINFIKKNLNLNDFNLLIDVGGHHGETIDLFCKNFKIVKLISIEASPKNFEVLKSKVRILKKIFFDTTILIEQLTLGNQNKLVNIKQFEESSSSTIKEIDKNSSYYKKKDKYNSDDKLTDEDIIECIKTVMDPEIPVNLYDLGLIYKINITQDNEVKIEMTLTNPNCPVAGIMPENVGKSIEKLENLNSIEVSLVWEPKWHKDLMSEDAKLALDIF